ncbi:unnamed protein product [Vitrella brassicaformis CCMP3155]|uniref:Uncharacterized protein n=1 Tax=Vitrella brassicaformis (strain CCMP3155) TaxID=1169540 RepID=A0A0G4FJ83_VITBC|nr:unnamed protein product [Vitrella brassicaformis CCMP3155]|mmetsp:Transcript_22275/g.63576  ORF Transcript_22275/g.63576 Transcript_22275/m.63576 type:complete len:111 (+) Transcript_22275:329-661(+)|eukprot:CEM13111.1 unnamed protein product [Vitrella brassicaformis CCMP3155]
MSSLTSSNAWRAQTGLFGRGSLEDFIVQRIQCDANDCTDKLRNAKDKEEGKAAIETTEHVIKHYREFETELGSEPGVSETMRKRCSETMHKCTEGLLNDIMSVKERLQLT